MLTRLLVIFGVVTAALVFLGEDGDRTAARSNVSAWEQVDGFLQEHIDRRMHREVQKTLRASVEEGSGFAQAVEAEVTKLVD